jgi:hypothetical protein
VNSLLGGFAIWLIYRLGSKIAGPSVGVIASGLAAVSPMLLMLSGSLMPHPLSLFLSTSFMLAWLDLFSTESQLHTSDVPKGLLVMVAGLSAGLLVLTRPLTAVGILMPFFLHGVILFLRGGPDRRRTLIVLAAVAGGTSLILLLWNGVLTGDPLLSPYTLWWSYDRVGFGPGFGVTESGHNLSLALDNTAFSLRAGQHDLFGWPYLSWLFIPFGLYALRRNLSGWLIFATFPALLLVYSAYWIGSWLYGPRYYYESLAGLAVVSATGICWLATCLPGQARSRWRRAVTILVTVILVVLSIQFYLPIRLGGMHGLYGISRSDLLPLEWAPISDELIIIHTSRWNEYARLVLLTPPFEETELRIAWSRGPTLDRELAATYPNKRVLHFYPDDPTHLYTAPRPAGFDDE